MRRIKFKGLSFDTIKLEGSVFTAEIVEKAVYGKDAAKTSDADYHVPRGLRLLDEIGRSFQIAQAQWNSFENGKLDEARFIKEFFTDALSYPENIFEKLVNINPLESDILWYINSNCRYVRLLRKSSSLARPSYLEFNLETILRENRFSEYQMLYRIMHASRADGLVPKQSDALTKRAGECVWDIWKKDGEVLGVRVREGLRQGVTKALTVLGSGFLHYDLPGNDRLRADLESGSLGVQEYFLELMRLMYRFLFIITIEERGLIFNHLSESEEEQIDGTNSESGKLSAELHTKHMIYEKGYSLRRLRDRSARYTSGDTYGDMWEEIKIVFALLGGNSKSKTNPLDLPLLGGLFHEDQCRHLDNCGISNAYLLEAMYRLRWTVDGNARTLIDYKNMGSEELGSVYESLLELVPLLDTSRRSFGFIGIDVEGSTSGNTRKTTGSYYTNASLVECLLKSNLDPLIEEKLAEKNNLSDEQKILAITVIDPACGSGHFLLAASRRLADRLAFIRADGAAFVDPDVYRNSLRDVIAACIYGVDLNPLAVELARMALWLEGHEPGKPLSFLDHHIRCGNSLVGVMDFDVLNKGIPDDAYKVLSGDDKDFVSALKKRNKKETTESERKQFALFEKAIEKAEASLTQLHWRIEQIQNNTLEDIMNKQALFENLLCNADYLQAKRACDMYVSAFYAQKKNGSIVPTSADMNRAASGLDESTFSAGVNALSKTIAAENRFFHWRLEFPEIFSKGGFTCVLGNPPWERIKLQEEEYFAPRKSEITEAANKAVRDKMIRDLQKSESSDYDKQLYRGFMSARRNAESASAFAHVAKDDGGRFPLTGIGDVNTYALFAETILHIKQQKGRAGFIVPTGIATDDSTKNYFAKISAANLVSLYDFENREKIFPAVDSRMKFSLLSLGEGEYADLAFFLTNTNQLADERRHFRLARDEFTLLNPNTQTCPVFRSEKDAELTKKIYRNVPVLINEKDVSVVEYGNPWGIRFMAMFHMSNDSHLFYNEGGAGRLPLYEAKMMHQFDHRWATYLDSEKTADVMPEQKRDVNFSITPRYWIDEEEVTKRIAGDNDNKLKKDKASIPKWLMGWRDITNATNERTVIVSVLPISAVNHKLPLFVFGKKTTTINSCCLFANLNSFVLDYIARQKMGGTDLTYHYLKQFPILPPQDYSQDDIDFIVPRVLELTYTARDLIPFAEDLWDSADRNMRCLFLSQRHGEKAAAFEEYTRCDSANFPVNKSERKSLQDILPPFVFDAEKRALLRAALDARYARLYGLSRDELRYILDPSDLMGADYPSETFRVLKDGEMKAYGEYRTGRLVLEAWDRE